MESTPPLFWLLGAREHRSIAWRYWIHDAIKGLTKTALHEGLRLLPTDACSAFGAAMSFLSPHRYRDSDARARRLWIKQHPEASDQESVDAAMRRLWRSVGRTMAEFSVLDRLWGEGRVEIEGLEHLNAARNARKRILFAGLHLGNWEVVPATGLALGLEGSAFYLIPENRFEHSIAVKSRKRYGGRMFPAISANALEAMRELLKGTGPFLIYIDEFNRGDVLAPAFGRPLRRDGNMAFAIRVAEKTDAALIPVYCVRVGDQARFQIHILQPLALLTTGDRAANLDHNIAKLNGIIEPIVQAHLDQWFYALDFEEKP